MKTTDLFCLLFLLSWITLPALAQRQQDLIVVKDSITGKDTILTNIFIADDSPQQMQYVINTRSHYLGSRTFRPTDIKAFRKGKKAYYSHQLNVEGSIRTLFLQRIYYRLKDSLSIYQFVNDRKRNVRYYQLGASADLKPLKAADGSNALAEYLLQSSVAQSDEELQKYIRRMKPTLSSYKKRARICLTRNVNLIPAFRWGVLAGGGFSQLKREDSGRFDKQSQWYVGAFADIPIMYGGLTFHPEVTFLKESALDLIAHINDYDIAYNRTSLRLPLLLRYTIVHINGRLLPYMQAGPELNFKLKGDVKTNLYPVGEDGFTLPPEQRTEALQSFLMAFSTGVGIEYKTSRHHSLFLDMRYLKNCQADIYGFQSSGIYFTLSYNL